MLHTILLGIQVALGIVLILAILLQQKGTGMGLAFGSTSNIYSTKRGIDKILFHTTIVVSILFFGLGLVMVVL